MNSFMKTGWTRLCGNLDISYNWCQCLLLDWQITITHGWKSLKFMRKITGVNRFDQIVDRQSRLELYQTTTYFHSAQVIWFCCWKSQDSMVCVAWEDMQCRSHMLPNRFERWRHLWLPERLPTPLGENPFQFNPLSKHHCHCLDAIAQYYLDPPVTNTYILDWGKRDGVSLHSCQMWFCPDSLCHFPPTVWHTTTRKHYINTSKAGQKLSHWSMWMLHQLFCMPSLVSSCCA